MSAIELSGRGLHTGTESRVRLSRTEGPVTLEAGGEKSALSSWHVADAFRSTTLAHDKARVRTVEHLCAALFGLSIGEGLAIIVEGPELPLLDGGATQWAESLATLDIPPTKNAHHITRTAIIDIADSRYAFSPPPSTTATPTATLAVTLSLDDPRYALSATWRIGDRASFLSRIAPSRTFSREADITELLDRGVASWVPPDSVVVLRPPPHAPLFAGRPFDADEPARHKLLDLIGDLYARVGLLDGSVHATKPGHARNHEAITRALADGILL
jgi:UDP-3-O-[3-hydroxymyristoyl] N-acetylglucosamine deacetylase